jgi:hypothetical protein
MVRLIFSFHTNGTLKERRCKALANAKSEGALGLGHAIIEGHLFQQDQDRYITYLDVILRSRSCELGLPYSPVTNRRQYLFHKRDPRRYQVLVEYLVQEFHSTDYNGESSLNAVKALCFFRAFYEEQNWKFSPWVDQAVDRVWAEISSEHDEVSYFLMLKECPVAHLTVSRCARILASFLPSRVKSK